MWGVVWLDNDMEFNSFRIYGKNLGEVRYVVLFECIGGTTERMVGNTVERNAVYRFWTSLSIGASQSRGQMMVD